MHSSPMPKPELFETFDSIESLVTRPGLVSYASVGSQGEGLRVQMGGRQSRSWEAIRGLAVSDDGKTLAYRARKGDLWFVVSGSLSRGKEGPPFQEVGDPVLSPDGTSVAHAAREGASWVVLAGPRKSGPFDQVWSPVFSEDGATVTFAARKGRDVWRKTLGAK